MEAIRLKNYEPMMITWDTGRRCNFDCTYCDLTRHDLVSPLISLKDLINTYHFVQEYTKIYKQPNANIAFTGGEPTINPAFWQLVNEIEDFTLGLTTNGTFAPKHLETIQDRFVAATISWHAEIDPKLRDRALNNAIEMHRNGFNVRVNVMMHTDYWNECVVAHNTLVDAGVTTNPVIIGDGNLGNTEWFEDSNGDRRRTSHAYTPEQQKWYFTVKGIYSDLIDQIRSGNQLPRSCCGNRSLMGCCNGSWKDIDAVQTNFKGWHCSVNKYFMHIEQQTGNVYHHQTCQAKFKGQGPIGNLAQKAAILQYARENLKNTIICPNDRCGCGMCAPKALDKIEFDRLVG